MTKKHEPFDFLGDFYPDPGEHGYIDVSDPPPMDGWTPAHAVAFAMAGMKLAIVGSSELNSGQMTRQAAIIIARLLTYYKTMVYLVVSGGATGIDTMAAAYADVYGIKKSIHLPTARDWPAFKVRNLRIAQECDCLVRIVRRDSKTYGSGWTLDRAKEMGKPTQKFIIDDTEGRDATLFSKGND